MSCLCPFGMVDTASRRLARTFASITFLGEPSNITMLEPEMCGTAESAVLTANSFLLGFEVVRFGPKKGLFPVALLICILHPRHLSS
jgi:hypothetical protein